MSTIRNTNTKIIMRLPDLSDRELVGKAANLNDDQITELAKLPRGVAAVYQNEWIQPALCKVNHYIGSEEPYQYNPDPSHDIYDESSTHWAKDTLLDCIMNKELFQKGNREDIRKLKDKVLQSKLDTKVKCDLIDYLQANQDNAIESLQKLIYDLLEAKEALTLSENSNDIKEWIHMVVEKLNPSIQNYSQRQIDLAMALILLEQVNRDRSYKDILDAFTEVYRHEGGVF